jgi:hypothetical protein
MAKGQLPSRLVVYACPAAETAHIQAITEWKYQHLLLGFQSGAISLRLSPLEAEDLVSELAKIPNCYFELIQTARNSGTLFMHVPGQGIFRGELNVAGSLTLSEDQLQIMLTQAAGNFREFNRLLRLALGQSWDDILEPFRAQQYSENVVLLNRAG